MKRKSISPYELHDAGVNLDPSNPQIHHYGHDDADHYYDHPASLLSWHHLIDWHDRHIADTTSWDPHLVEILGNARIEDPCAAVVGMAVDSTDDDILALLLVAAVVVGLDS